MNDAGYDPDIGLMGRESRPSDNALLRASASESTIAAPAFATPHAATVAANAGATAATASAPADAASAPVESTLPSLEELPAFVPQQLIDRCMGNLAFAQRLLTSFERRFEVDFAQLERNLEALNAPQVASVAHQLKGASANISAPRLQRVAAKIEESSRADRMAVVPDQLAALGAEWRRFNECRALLKIDKSLEEPRR